MLVRWRIAVTVAILLVAARNALQGQVTTTWPDPVANHVLPYQASGLTHGPMLGRPTADSMRVWVRTREPMEFRVVYDTETPLTADSPGVAGRTRADRDNTGVVDLTGLQADTRYYYGIVLGGKLADIRMDFDQPWPRFRTLPDAESYADPKYNQEGLFNVCFSVGCCASQQPFHSGGHYGNPPSFGTLRKRHGGDLMFHLMNGDYIYEEKRDGRFSGYRANYRVYMERGRHVSNFFHYTPGLFTFDDHETGGDVQGPGEIGVRGSGPWLMRDVSMKPWYEYCGWANFTGAQNARPRYGTAEVEAEGDVLHDPEADFSMLDPRTVSTIHVWKGQQNAGIYGLGEVLDEHRLRVRPAFRADETCRYSIGTHNYFDWQVGNCHFFALDTRSERTGFNYAKRHDADRHILGEAQRRWLTEGVQSTDADFVFIVSSVPWTVFHTSHHVQKNPPANPKPKGDTFGGFLHEREKLLDVFDGLQKPVIIFSGDVHNSMAIEVSDNVWEFLCGPMNSTAHPIGTAGNPPFGGRFDSEGRNVKIKWVAGFPNNVHYSRLRSTYYAVVQVNNVLKTARPEGTGYQWVAYNAPQVVVRFHDGYTGKLIYAEGISTLDARSTSQAE